MLKDQERSLIVPKIEFRETEQGYLPLTLLFDQKDAFGNFSSCFNGLDQVDPAREHRAAQLEYEGRVEYREEEQIERSEFHQAMDPQEEDPFSNLGNF